MFQFAELYAILVPNRRSELTTKFITRREKLKRGLTFWFRSLTRCLHINLFFSFSFLLTVQPANHSTGSQTDRKMQQHETISSSRARSVKIQATHCWTRTEFVFWSSTRFHSGSLSFNCPVIHVSTRLMEPPYKTSVVLKFFILASHGELLEFCYLNLAFSEP